MNREEYLQEELRILRFGCAALGRAEIRVKDGGDTNG